MQVSLSSCGAGIRDVLVPDNNGVARTVTLRPMDESNMFNTYHGKTVGRTAGRIKDACFTIDGKTAHLAKNNKGVDDLHGGTEGIHARVFSYQVEEGKDSTKVIFKYRSPDGAGGYFGNVDIVVTYVVCENENDFSIIYDATTDEKTLLNLTNHVYWNMSGDLRETVENQIMYLSAPYYASLDERLIITGKVPVNEVMDFRTPHEVGKYIEDPELQKYTKGYDHPFFLDVKSKDEVAASLVSALSGIKLEVRTTYPLAVVYADCQANPNVEVYPGKMDKKYLAICYECQYHSDGTRWEKDADYGVITPEKPYHNEIHYTFSLVK